VTDLNKKLFSLIDLTSLNESDTDESITALCQKAVSPLGQVAAVCVFPRFVKLAKSLLPASVRIATVANFPSGNESLETVLDTITQALQDGADEIDVVLPYQRYLNGEHADALAQVAACKKACGDKLLKVILETGAFPDAQTIFQASKAALLAGADFVKTSTGKIATGATPEAARAMVMAIKEGSSQVNRVLGFKASGGVRTREQALIYYQLASELMNEAWISPQTFRIGASQLVGELG